VFGRHQTDIVHIYALVLIVIVIASH
jgi:hypothetical protein